MNDKIRSRLSDCLVAAQLIHEWAQEDTKDSVRNDIKAESAYVLQFERIGESLRVVRDIDPYFGDQLSDIHEWIGMRHVLVHEYRDIDLDLLWQYATHDIPDLIGRLEALIQQ